MSYDFECYCAKDMHCVFCEMATVARLNVLATNLAWAASLCRAFTLGARRGFDVGAFPEIVSDEWRPGCQRQAP